jgi:hypothetical protein
MLALLPRAAFLKIEKDGFTFVSYFTVAKFTWQEVDYFRVEKQAGMPTVTFEYLAAEACGSVFARREAVLPYTMGFSPTKLSRLLSDAKRESKQTA